MKFFVPALLALSSLASVQAFTGDGTWFTPGLGACGRFNTENDFIVALGHGSFDFPGAPTNPNNNPLCGRNIRATYQGRSVVVTLVDRCAGCAGADDLDFSPAAFSVLAPLSVGRLFGVQWDYI